MVPPAFPSQAEQWRQLFEAVTDAVMVLDRDHRVIEANAATAALLGLDREAILGRRCHEVVHQRDDPRPGCTVKRTLASGRREQGEFERQGNHLRSLAYPLTDEAGEVTHVIHILRDITARKQAEEKLKKRTYDLGERVKELEGLYGTSQLIANSESTMDEVLQGAVDLIPPSWQYPEITCAKITFEGKEFKTPNWKKSKWMQSANIISNKGKVGTIEVAYPKQKPEIDEGPFLKEERNLIEGLARILGGFTARRQTEAALRESEARFRGAFESAAVGVVLVDTGGRIVRANQALCELLGYTEAELRAKTFSEVTHPDDIRTGAYEMQRLLSGEAKRAKFEKRYIHQQGHEIWALVSPSLVRDPDGKPLCFVTQVQDITERKRAAAALKEYSVHLEEMVAGRTRKLVEAQEALVRKEKLALLGQLAGSVSHELRNPLGVISNAVYYLQTISRDADAKTREYLAIIADEVRQSEAIITGLLDFGRLQPPQRAPTAVAQLVTRALARQPPPPEVKVTTELPSDLPAVAVDARQMRQVLVNLISNACQAMPGGGRLTVTARPHYEQVLLAVTDTGRGIAPENLEQVFEPLFTTRARGLGLGLALSRQLAEAGGGSLTVASEPGQGTTFTLTLPRSESD